ncbi:F0F1 ATP synthase subunit epsilon [Loigolactobacillus backii]|uniref:ATP synthase epsilon chain n=1 Tax=Loigolactobacillus backii TaxID=375175 RepID=A0A192H4N7_9LACO|nr:F0F1 ATP synthase subunit epsilon [Loigolactobacillus backii]ANK59870.1 F0F1 ATP synthase subunit epsilon [Loigolactobacillus backii]ANK63208.1 F0F1 ATP synthase subunit epsilon [Loigolactobacillus backii]ANK64803.1 F0F1 ATP synthase subunit epsilon [Loigolactobacillus backii]ANK66749.1 F0F1 ATP synthase subunit epsilon [Loigolactobacillus backii]ANK69786.1 F0F1 ATP synthase subunit epsilon [Loigolactobacillus backii]
MADKPVLTVNIVTPDGIIYNHHATMIIVNALDGQLGIMPNHEPIVAPLQIDEVRVKRVDQSEHEDAIAVNGGFMEVSGNVASIIADSAERERDIDVSRAQLAEHRAEENIKKAQEKEDTDELQRAQIKLKRAMNRINVSKH